MAPQRPFLVGRVTVSVLASIFLAGSAFHPDSPAFGGSAASSQVVQGPTSGAIVAKIQVTGVNIQVPNPGETDVDIAASSTIAYKILELKNPHRLVVDLQGAVKATPQPAYTSSSNFLTRVRISQFQSNPAVVRVVADLTGDPAFTVEPASAGIRISLRSRTAPPPATSQPAVAPVVTQQPVAAPPLPPPQNMTPPSKAFFVKAPFGSLNQNEKMLDALGLRIVMSFNYKEGKADEAVWKTKGLPGVVATRRFFKQLSPGVNQTVELALQPSPSGGFDLGVYCDRLNQNAEEANPDFFSIQQLVNEQSNQMAQSPASTDPRDMAYQVYYLSYVVADHAMALLKTMGYTTVEYNAQPGETSLQSIYNPVKLGTKPPIIVKLIDSNKTSLMEPTATTPGAPMQPQMPQGQAQAAGLAGGGYSGTPQIGGTYLHGMTSGEPQERLLILYDKNDPNSLQEVINLLQDTIDVPSREILIDALVIELNSTKARDLGVTFNSQQNQYGASSVSTDATTGATLPFVLSFDKNLPKAATFQAQLNALLTSNEAEILSNPSVLVLDDRQARIQIGQQVPVSKQLLNGLQTITSVDYFPVGIVLNMRPRISEDGNDVTMQTETIVSAINSSASKAIGTSVSVAPVIDNREVQSIVRVSDNTPFIIGGLISTNNTTQVSGIPLLSQIPVFGNLFKNTVTSKQKQEVIIVVTPHVMPLEDKYFSYVIPKDSKIFDRPDFRLFRNAYRIRGNDIYDLSFVYDSSVYKNLRSRVASLDKSNPALEKDPAFESVLNGGVPGENIMVERMLWEIIDKTHYAQYVTPDHIFFFDNDSAVPGGFRMAYLNQVLTGSHKQGTDIGISFEAAPKGTDDRPFVPPKGTVSFPNLTQQNFFSSLAEGNDRNPDGSPKDWMVLVNGSKSNIMIRRNSVSPLELLEGVLVLKRVLELNSTLPPTLRDFHIGRQIIFPSQDELRGGYHVIDREAARLFYEVANYYPAFEQEFNRETRQINSMLDKAENHQP